jgi:hypothetical protein
MKGVEVHILFNLSVVDSATRYLSEGCTLAIARAHCLFLQTPLLSSFTILSALDRQKPAPERTNLVHAPFLFPLCFARSHFTFASHVRLLACARPGTGEA